MSLPPNPPCGGIDAYDGTGKRLIKRGECCETHVLPRGHDRSELGILKGIVEPDPPVVDSGT